MTILFLPRFRGAAFAVWRRNTLVWRKLAAASLFGNFGEPLLYLLALGYGMGRLIGEVGGMPYLHYLASGIVCSSSMMTASFEGTCVSVTSIASAADTSPTAMSFDAAV